MKVKYCPFCGSQKITCVDPHGIPKFQCEECKEVFGIATYTSKLIKTILRGKIHESKRI